MDYEPRERITPATKMTMIMVATAIWLIGLIPFVDWVTDPLQWIIFWLWFKMRGASLAKNKVKNIISAVLSLVPTVGALLSAFPVVIYLNIRSIQKEDDEYNDAMGVERLSEEEEAYSVRQQAQYERDMGEQDAEDLVEEEQVQETEEGIVYKENAAGEIVSEKQRDSEKIDDTEQSSGTPIGEDAFDALKNKQDKTNEEKARLKRAEQIRATGVLPVGEHTPENEAAAEQYKLEKIKSRQTRKESP